MFVELDFDFLGIIVSKVGILITCEPNKLLDEHYKTKIARHYQLEIDENGLSRVQSKIWSTKLTILTAWQVLVHCCFLRFVYFIITKQVKSSLTV